jgi:hypothetical protein
VQRPESKVVPDPALRYPERVIDYPLIDAGRTRRERIAEIADLNIERAARSPDFQTRAMAQFEREQRTKDRVTEAEITAAARRAPWRSGATSRSASRPAWRCSVRSTLGTGCSRSPSKPSATVLLARRPAATGTTRTASSRAQARRETPFRRRRRDFE